jgi:hypothetical protein
MFDEKRKQNKRMKEQQINNVVEKNPIKDAQSVVVEPVETEEPKAIEVSVVKEEIPQEKKIPKLEIVEDTSSKPTVKEEQRKTDPKKNSTVSTNKKNTNK